MAGNDIDDRPRRKHATSVRRSSKPQKTRKHDDTADDKDTVATPKPPSLDELRRSRVAYFSAPETERRKKMKYVYDQPLPTRRVITKEEPKDHRGGTSTSKAKRGEPRHKHRSRNQQEESESEGDADKVYVMRSEPRRRSSTQAGTLPKEKPRKETNGKVPTKRSSQRGTTTQQRQAPQRRHTEPSKSVSQSQPVLDECHRSTDRSAPATTTKGATRPQLKRRATIGAARTEVSLAKSITSNQIEKRPSSVFSSLFQRKPPSPDKKVSCLTCGDDDIPMFKSARLPCKHHMCHSCLKRVFKMSITDPAHMPPRCCTDDHIDLKHVDKLFSQDFKKTWNRKFLEYKTKNRVYCIGRNCGDWIKPSHISIEHGRKIGKCKRCGTKVCAICNNKAHTSRDCPKDPATKQFIETAKQKGWQKCYRCSAMVELKEGCNHMTCRCTAEFCMVCGLKWKSCDCPWFNYEAADAHLGNPQRYQEELDRRRTQEQRDEALARRMEVLGLDEDQVGGGFFGLGNAAGHHMNQNFIQQAREALTANYQNAEQAARGLINGWYMGRENRMPGIPEDLADLPQLLRQEAQTHGGNEDEAEEFVHSGRRRRYRRRTTQPEPVDAPPEIGRNQPTEDDRDQDRRIREWATGVQE